ncbi:MAG: pPIWI_RE module domain-containing protein, partial [Candidatus Woesearchaeota archaeon]
MMTNYDLKILAALIDKEVDKELDYYTLSFPDSWLKRLNRLYSKISRNTNSYFPIKSLSNVLMSLFPEIIKTENNFYKMKRVWLISTKRISIKTLFHIIKIWIKIVFKKAKSNKINLNILEEQIKLQDLTWKKERINLIESRLSENGTFQPKGEYFNIIPEHFLQRLIDENFQVKLNHEKFNFKKVGDELISWTPKKYYYNNEASFYSLKLKLKTVTYPFLDQPVIQFLPSFSPWISNSLKYGDNYNLKYQKSSSVYIHMIDPFLVNNNANSLLKASISKYNKKLRWDNYILEIMSSLSVEEKLPKIEKLANNPITFLENKGGIQAAIAASNNIYSVSRQVLPPGLSLIDQKNIFLQALEYLPELINFNQEYQSQRFSGGIRRDVAILKNRSDQAKSERRE